MCRPSGKNVPSSSVHYFIQMCSELFFFLSRKNDKILMVGYPRQIMFGAHALVLPQNGLDWKSTKTHEQLRPPSLCLSLSVPGCITMVNIQGKQQRFLEYTILSVPGQKTVCLKELKLNWNEKSPGC